MLGGGVYVTQNKLLPGSYINFVNASNPNATLGERGVVAIALPIGKNPGKVISITRTEFIENSMDILGKEYSADDMTCLREIFRNATKVYIYDSKAGDGEEALTVSDALTALESYDFNVLCVYTDNADDIAQYLTEIKSWRDDYGKKCQVVVYNQEQPDYEGVINVVSTVSDENAPEYALTAWVAGMEAGCAINESCTNKMYDGEYDVICNKKQSELEECITNGQLVFHLVYGDVRVLEDINSLVTTTDTKGDDFKSNQTIRVIDQIANDIAKLFNTKYLGNIPNNASGRVSLWADIVKHHKQLEEIQAIENFDSSQLTVEQGNTKKSVVVNDTVSVVNAMSQVYMTVVVQ